MPTLLWWSWGGGGAVSYERGTPIPTMRVMQEPMSLKYEPASLRQVPPEGLVTCCISPGSTFGGPGGAPMVVGGLFLMGEVPLQVPLEGLVTCCVSRGGP